MKKHIYDEEHNTHLDQWRQGLLRQEFHSYEQIDGHLRKHTVVRTYYSNGEYSDRTSIETIDHAKQ